MKRRVINCFSHYQHQSIFLTFLTTSNYCLGKSLGTTKGLMVINSVASFLGVEV